VQWAQDDVETRSSAGVGAMTENEFYYESMRIADLVDRVQNWEPQAAQMAAQWLRDQTGHAVYAPDVLTWLNSGEELERRKTNDKFWPVGSACGEVLGATLIIRGTHPGFQWRQLKDVGAMSVWKGWGHD
jgi:hypothetical protein